ncbi:MAG: S8 family serine peptidase [Anaerolineae bacterium]|nr:S8 family serine peptidase [Anaerolineae bacterium]
MEKYVVLRVLRPAITGFGPAIGQHVIADEIKIETSEVSRREIGDLKRDPQIQAFAPDIQIKLYEPVARDIDVKEKDGTAWGIRAVGADTTPFSGKGITVAILDTGINAAHEAFHSVKITEQDFTGEGNGDRNGHGTHCAGIIFGQAVDGLRIGVAPGIQQALIGKVLDSQGRGSTASISKGIQWALDTGAQVISMSLGMDFPGQVQRLVQESNLPIDLATSKVLEAYLGNVSLFGKLAELAQSRSALFQATVIVAASGNESQRDKGADYEIAVSPPASADHICAVGALMKSENGLDVATFSNTSVAISAPGVAITSANADGGLTGMSGTSMAAPHVAGVAALWAEKFLSETGRIDATAFSAKLIASGTHNDLIKPIDTMDVGTGIVQAPQ